MHLCRNVVKLFTFMVKTLQFHLNEYRRHTLTSRCDVISDVMNTKNTFYVKFAMFFLYLLSKWTYVKYFENFEMAPFCGSGAFWNRACTGSWVLTKLGMSFPTFWDFVRRSSSNIDGVMAISKFDLLLGSRDLVMWPLIYENYRFLCWNRLHMWTEFGDDWSKSVRPE